MALVGMLMVGAAGAAPAANAAAPTRYVSEGTGPTHSGAQGGLWYLVFKTGSARSVRYRVCVRQVRTGAHRCVTATARRRHPSQINMSLFVNDGAPPGPWQATWTIARKTVGVWRFTVISESG